MNRLIAKAYERITGTPWTTRRSAAAEFGPTLATRYPELAGYSDAELLARPTAEILAEIRAQRAAQLDAAHHHTAGWGGVPGECGVECACGLTYDGFDTIAEAAALLDNHIARETGRRPKELTR